MCGKWVQYFTSLIILCNKKNSMCGLIIIKFKKYLRTKTQTFLFEYIWIFFGSSAFGSDEETDDDEEQAIDEEPEQDEQNEEQVDENVHQGKDKEEREEEKEVQLEDEEEEEECLVIPIEQSPIQLEEEDENVSGAEMMSSSEEEHAVAVDEVSQYRHNLRLFKLMTKY